MNISTDYNNLIAACIKEDQIMVKSLIKSHNLDLNYLNGHVINKAIEGGVNPDFLLFLKQQGANLHISSPNYNFGVLKGLENPLCVASLYGKYKVVQYLIEQEGADFRVDEYRPFRYAAEHGHTKIANYLYKLGSPLDSMEYYGFIEACLVGHSSMVKWFLKQDKEIVEKAPEGINWAVSNHNLEILDILLHKNANVHLVTEETLKKSLSSSAKEKLSIKPRLEILNRLYNAGYQFHSMNIFTQIREDGRDYHEADYKWLDSYFQNEKLQNELVQKSGTTKKAKI